MTTLTVTAKGQITLKRAVLEHLGVQPEQRLGLRLLPGGRLELASERGADLVSLKGLLHDPNRKPATREEIQDAIQAGWAGDVEMD
jgi:hypothetical protein